MPRNAPPKKRLLTTVLFTDIVGSTQRATELGDRRWRQLLTSHHNIVRKALKRHGGREIDTAGDGFFATFDQPSDAIDCGMELIGSLKRAGIDIRAGVHMGEVETMGKTFGGIAVHVGARVMSQAGAGQLFVSNTVRDLMAGSDLQFADAGVHELKGVTQQMHLFAVRIPETAAEDEPREPESPDEGRSRRRRWLVAAALVTVLAVVAAFILLRNREPEFSPAPNTVVRLDPETGTVTGGVGVGTTPTGLAFGEGSLWVANFDDKTVQAIDADALTASPAKGGVLSNPTGIAVGGGAVWVTNGFAGQVVKIAPGEANSVVPIDVASGVQGVAFGFDVVWVASPIDGSLYRLDPQTNDVTRLALGSDAPDPVDVAVGEDAVWVADHQGGRVFEVDPATFKVRETIPMRQGHPSRITTGEGSVWVTSLDDDSVTRIDPASGRTTTIANVGNGPLGIAVGAGSVWVANSLDGTVARIDPSTARVAGRTRLGFSPDAIAVTPGAVWVSVHTL
jgi:YVTN family beta-propeller protein